MREVALGRVVDDVGERQIERLVAELHRIGLLRLGDHLVEEQRIHGGRLLAHQARERGALGAVALAGGAQAAEQMHLEAGGLRQLVGRQLRAALVEVVGDAHRPDRVRARGAGADLVELVHHGHHRALGLLDDVEVGREDAAHLEPGSVLRGRLRGLLRGGLRRGLLRAGLGRPGGSGHHRRRADGGVAHEERPAVDARWRVRRFRQGKARPCFSSSCVRPPAEVEVRQALLMMPDLVLDAGWESLSPAV